MKGDGEWECRCRYGWYLKKPNSSLSIRNPQLWWCYLISAFEDTCSRTQNRFFLLLSPWMLWWLLLFVVCYVVSVDGRWRQPDSDFGWLQFTCRFHEAQDIARKDDCLDKIVMKCEMEWNVCKCMMMVTKKIIIKKMKSKLRNETPILTDFLYFCFGLFFFLIFFCCCCC